MSESDALIDRLRARAADPERRVDARQNQFMAGVSTLDLGGLMGMLGSVSGDLQRLVAANQGGAAIDPTIQTRAHAFGQQMATPVATSLPPPATGDAIKAAEASLGAALPAFLRRVYTEAADGGFGPGTGLLSVAAAVAEYERMRLGDELPRGRSWPEALLPIAERNPGFYCLDCTTAAGRVVDWDPEELGEFSGEKAFAKSFSEIAPSVEAWLSDWVGSKTQAEQHADMMAAAMATANAQTQAYWRNMSPEQRASYGLSDAAMRELMGDDDAPRRG
ncbi:MAG: SMI1/KNR4 family protein [Chloroflexota bacterium]